MQMKLNSSFKIRELEVGFKATRYKPLARIASPQDIYEFCRPMIRQQPRERLISIALATNNQVVGFEIVSQGTANASLAYPAEVFKAVLLTNATSFILAHNHPSGNCQPSNDDRLIAKRMAQAARIIGLEILDFIIVTEERYYSFAQSEPSILKEGGE